ncbi:MAG: hypothetical protein A2428_13215 [Bdellovibrionales bacterium RIFOXYC1_FULL_54_43]|nr:MAG: hypothetical protein A2428_13215 [Bdellovibrionales bacterium RIFOXYC1_FULL_54_43]OFZ83683.1 MAG: hypothetical protein A2603_16665 [Bdellovibrionales bacterium RIFOXYD1_FULL_55_31]
MPRPKIHELEEAYFERENRELIERRRREIESRQRREIRPPNWMRCPKCGYEMQTVDFSGISVERCPSCLGIYLDHNELEGILRSKRSNGFFQRILKKLFKPDDSYTNWRP